LPDDPRLKNRSSASFGGAKQSGGLAKGIRPWAPVIRGENALGRAKGRIYGLERIGGKKKEEVIRSYDNSSKSEAAAPCAKMNNGPG